MPRFYVNVHMTLITILVTGTVVAYIADFKGMRESINDLVGGLR